MPGHSAAVSDTLDITTGAREEVGQNDDPASKIITYLIFMKRA